MNAIEIVDLTKRYKDVTAVKELTLSVKDGELFSLLGVNGAGKTTAIKMLTALLKPTSGNAFIYGNSVVTDKNKVKELVDISMQETAIARKLTVKENIYFYADLNGLTKEERENTARELFEEFDFYGVKDKQAGKLSGGWQRKLSIALALISRPKVLFLDEPTLGLDVIARRELWKVIGSLKGKMTIVLTTHYMEEAEALSDRIGVMKGGKLLFIGSKSEMYAKTGKNDVENAFISIIEGEGKDE